MLDLIVKKRDGKKITADEFDQLIKKVVRREIPDYQLSALLMAIYFRGLNFQETTHLTRAMLCSGQILKFAGRAIDKHSTGGVGDKTSLILAPLAASFDIKVPMIAGRGLGITGGTIDKLESIKGFRANLNISTFKRLVNKYNLSIIGQTAKIAPADKILYLLRDVTGSVPSIPLITASIMSKKLAEGISGLALDIKCGSGAFVDTLAKARSLAKSLVAVATRFGQKCYYIISDMNNPLGHTIGNSLEIIESVEALKGNVQNDLVDLSLRLTGAMLLLAGMAQKMDDGISMAKKNLKNGKGLAKFREMIINQNGDSSFIDDYSKLELAPEYAVRSPRSGYLQKIDALTIGNIVKDIGGGRKTKKDKIDHGVGIRLAKKPGDRVREGEILATIYLRKRDNAILNRVESGMLIGDKSPKLKLILEEGSEIC
jgi:pyrimidine-nucleoside phosphorylase